MIVEQHGNLANKIFIISSTNSGMNIFHRFQSKYKQTLKWSSEKNSCLCDYLQWYSFHRSDLVCLSFSPLIWKLSNALTTSGHTPSQNLTLPHEYLYAQYFGIISNFYVTCITSEREWDLLVKSKLTKLEEGNFFILTLLFVSFTFYSLSVCL